MRPPPVKKGGKEQRGEREWDYHPINYPIHAIKYLFAPICN